MLCLYFLLCSSHQLPFLPSFDDASVRENQGLGARGVNPRAGKRQRSKIRKETERMEDDGRAQKGKDGPKIGSGRWGFSSPVFVQLLPPHSALLTLCYGWLWVIPTPRERSAPNMAAGDGAKMDGIDRGCSSLDMSVRLAASAARVQRDEEWDGREQI
ncbi:hypothetical protein VTI74DRAFT_10382 [Chaetomium olivicolor]